MVKAIVKAVVGISALAFVGWLGGTGLGTWIAEDLE